jgi:periplasmic divalent cation tolerance protein
VASKSQEILVLMTVPSNMQASGLAKRLVQAKLAACVNLIGPIRSVYRWKGNVCDEQEVLLLAKTKQSLFESLEQMVKRHHSYENPEVIALPIVAGSQSYLKWIRDSTKKS